MPTPTEQSLITLAKQKRLIELGQRLLVNQPSIREIWDHSGYTGIVIEEFLEVSLRDETLVVKCEFPIDDDADSNLGHIYINLDKENKFVADF